LELVTQKEMESRVSISQHQPDTSHFKVSFPPLDYMIRGGERERQSEKSKEMDESESEKQNE
jgi:hypothetical protein